MIEIKFCLLYIQVQIDDSNFMVNSEAICEVILALISSDAEKESEWEIKFFFNEHLSHHMWLPFDQFENRQ